MCTNIVYLLLVLLTINISIISSSQILWKNEKKCPIICTCQMQHLSETAIYRFLQKDKNMPDEIEPVEMNDVFYNNNLEPELFEEKSIVQSATCILQTETEPTDLLEKLPDNIEILTIIQGYDTGNKTIKFSYLQDNFKQLLSFELLGPNLLNKQTNSHLICEIDTYLVSLKYLNFENILIKNSKKQLQNFVKEMNANEQVVFEYVQKSDNINAHPLTMVQKGINDEIVPYNKYKERDNNVNNIPLFIGFKNLFLLRITSCELNIVHWTMFDGLKKLQYLILEKNNLRFIPEFAFYGTPNLKTLSLAHNNLLDIEITDLAGLLVLEYLDLSFNNFSQLSELSLPPFPKLKLANFANNPITVIFPNTFEVMNTTDSLIIGNDDVPLSVITNSFVGLNSLTSIIINNLDISLLKRDLFVGMPNLNELTLTGNITTIEFDTFLEIYQLKKLILNNCKLRNISMDAFIGLEQLEYLDLSKNELESLKPGVFDQLISLKELYLNGNKFKQLPRDIFTKIRPKLIRLNENPWHCSCEMSEWKPMIVNKLKQKIIKQCDLAIMNDKMSGCTNENRFTYKYIYENKVAPKCAAPALYVNWSVFHVMRRLFKCPEYKPKFKKYSIKKNSTITKIQNHTRIKDGSKYNSIESTELQGNIRINQSMKIMHNHHKKNIDRSTIIIDDFNNNILNPLEGINNRPIHKKTSSYYKMRKISKARKHKKGTHQKPLQFNNNIN